MNELWKPLIDGYEISNLGNIRSMNRWVNNSGNPNGGYYLKSRLMKIDSSGHIYLGNKNFIIDEEVCNHFIRPLHEHEFVVHIDGRSDNNSVSNLVIKCSTDFGSDWKYIPGFDNKYQVSREGCVRRIRHYSGKQLFRELIMKTKTDEDGYVRVNLTDDKNHSREYGIHQLVALAFIPNPENKPTVNHKDGNKNNNCVDNLEWATFTEQNHHAISTGLRDGTMKAARKISKLTISKPVRCLQTNQIFESCIDAERRLKLGSTAVYYAIHNGRPTKQGYTFEYVDKLS